MMTNQLDIVIPVLNEAKTLYIQIEKLLFFLKDCHINYKIIIADNGSKDDTRIEAQKLIHKYKNKITYLDVKIIGVGIALKTAWKNSSSQYLCTMDLDFSTDLTHFHEAHKLLITNEYDCIYGSRLIKNSNVIGRKLIRTTISRIYNSVLRLLFNINSSDAACGFKFLSRNYFNHVNKFSVSNGWFYSSELVIIGKFHGFRMYELPVLWRDDVNSQVKIFNLSLEYLKEMILLRFNLIKQ
jgi:glycosyltransferase involved in cell wall biosynthesis